MIVRVVHIGNNPNGSGGIASVIRGRMKASATVDAQCHSNICSYNQDSPSAIKRNWPAVHAFWKIIRVQVPCVLHFHISQRGSLLREGLLVALGRALRNRVVFVTLHGSSLATPDVASKIILRFIVRRLTDVTHVLDSVYLEKLALDGAQAIVLPNQVDLPPPSSTSRKSDQIVFVGEVGHRKGIDVLLSAWKDLPHRTWKLLIVGSVTHIGRQDLAAYRDVPDWEALGSVSQQAAWAIMDSSRILVQPSRAEAFPMSVCEAMARKCAIVGTSVGGLGTLLGEAGQVVIAPGDVQALASQLGDLMVDQDRCSVLGASARKFAERSLDACVIENQWAGLYGKLLGELPDRWASRCLEPGPWYS